MASCRVAAARAGGGAFRPLRRRASELLPPMSEFTGKVALVTGAGRGLGRAFAEHLASLGCKVVVHGRREAGPSEYGEGTTLTQTAKDIEAAHGVETLRVIGDLTVSADVEMIVAGVIVIVLKFALTVSCSIDVSSSGATVELSMDANIAGAMLGVLVASGIEALSDVNAKVFAVVIIALEFPLSSPVEDFSR